MTTTRIATIAASVLALALVGAGCGGSDESSSGSDVTPTSEWADGFCTAITTWTSDVSGIKDQFTDLSSFSEEGLQSAADDLKASTETLVESLKGLGAPDTESGDEVKSSIDELATTLETNLDEIETTVNEASGLTELPGAAQDVLASLSTMSSAFSSTLQVVGDADVQGELEDALESSPACEDITG